MDSSILNKYTPVIGLEVHAQLSTLSKIFSGDATTFGDKPNTNVSVVTLAHPGTLPKQNKKTIEYAIKMGIACNSEISRWQIFDRKNYFYPDLPKGYQITQDKTPICKGGYVTVKTSSNERLQIKLNRIHLEEDAGKSIHLDSDTDTLIDLNRAGVALIEIVTEPVIHTSEDASAFLTEVRKLVRYLDVCDGNMEEGSLRCDANVSVKLKEAKELGKKVEVKNMNSMRNVQRAIDREIVRQIEILERGEVVISETRTFDANTGLTHSMRTKEELNDYRYFPDPDLSPLHISEAWLASIKSTMPVLPHQLVDKYVHQLGLTEYDALLLTDSKELASYFDEVCEHTKNYKAASNWMMGPIKSYLNEQSIEVTAFSVKPKSIADIIALVDEGKMNFSIASKQLFPELLKNSEAKVVELAKQLNLIQDSNVDSLLPLVEEVIATFPEKVIEYKKGKKALLAMFMGEVMKRSKGKADPKVINELLINKLQ
jgi:aspartyl-tRNA(Asn)/glutamyl-tRNA(Gln) amidotransferase subunit B